MSGKKCKFVRKRLTNLRKFYRRKKLELSGKKRRILIGIVLAVSPLVNSSRTSAVDLPVLPVASIGHVQRYPICSPMEVVPQPIEIVTGKPDRVIYTPADLVSISFKILNSEIPILELRGGDGLLDIVAIFIFVWLSNLFEAPEVGGFQPIRPPHHERLILDLHIKQGMGKEEVESPNQNKHKMLILRKNIHQMIHAAISMLCVNWIHNRTEKL